MRPTPLRLRRSIIGLVLCALMTCGAAPPTVGRPPVEWLRKFARPFATCEPGGTDRDLAPLRAVVGDARVVALGEVSSGTHEFFQMKRRIVEYLATHMGFTLFAIEENMPDAYRVNEYVLDGRGDPKALLAGIARRRRTQEFLSFVEWMREFNRSGRGRLQFLGFDMLGSTDSASAAVTRFVARAEPAYLDSVTHAYRLVATAPRQESRAAGARGLFPASVAAGHKIRFSGWIRTENVHDGSAALWLRGDASRKNVVGGTTRDVSGTTPWTPYDFTLDIPDSISTIRFGCMLEGSGMAWFDSLAVEIDGIPFAGNESLDLTMERTDRPVGMDISVSKGGAYAIDLDSTTVFAGKRSLRIRRVAPDAPPATATWPEASAASTRVLEHLEAGRDRLVSSSAPADVDRAILNARTIAQMSDVNVGPAGKREDIMAENVARMLDQAAPGSRIVLWEQNLRLARRVSLGARLAGRYGREMVVIGFAFHEGSYNAVAAGDPPGEQLAKPSSPGSLEWACHSTGIPRFILDLRSAAADPGASGWLAQPLPMRNFAFEAIPEPIPVGQYYDALIYFDHTTPSKSLP
ncbi:MAG: erythromycin esterase family protein [Candidatus Eisenbacteria bacterium]|uniref:Erythromycin esterase family protein n=1 Tax=Eiseniibacteriota bacterium TaxID=2212470 RepID=A0A538SJW6_UNCEI|nr:MAG: erythromycin esterase family protein [Candidatus Eisenbacteria bacterium]